MGKQLVIGPTLERIHVSVIIWVKHIIIIIIIISAFMPFSAPKTKNIFGVFGYDFGQFFYIL